MARLSESMSEPKRIMTMAENKSDLDRELSDIKKEVIEGRNLVIKTDNLLKNLHAELKTVSKRQEEFEKRKLFSSGVAYVLFAVLAGVAAVLVSNARVSSAGADKDRDSKTIAQLTKAIEDAKKVEAERLAGTARAYDVYRQMTERPGDERLQGVEAFSKMDMRQVSALEKAALKDRAELLRNEIGQAAFERGKQAFRRNDMGAAVKELSRFMAMNPTKNDASEAAFFLGTAYNQLRQHDKAVQYLQMFVSSEKKAKTRDYAMLLLSQSYEQSGSAEKAAEVAREALGTYPGSEYLPQLKGRLSAAKRTLAAGSATAAPAAATAAPAAAPVVAKPAAVVPAPAK